MRSGSAMTLSLGRCGHRHDALPAPTDADCADGSDGSGDPDGYAASGTAGPLGGRYDARVRAEVSDRRPSAPLGGMRRLIDAGVVMRDGIRLSADVYLPVDDKGPVPAVLVRTPYNNSDPYYTDQARFFTQHGYAFVIQDCRGKFDSARRVPAVVQRRPRRLRHPAVGRHAALVRRQRRHGRVLVRRRDAVAGGAPRQSASARDGACRRSVGLLGAGSLRRRGVRAWPEPLVGRPERGPQPARTHAARDPAIVVAPAAGHGRCRGRHRHPVVPRMARPPGVRRLLADDRDARALRRRSMFRPSTSAAGTTPMPAQPSSISPASGRTARRSQRAGPSGSSWGRGTT